MSHHVFISEHVKQMFKQQDETAVGNARDAVTGEEFEYLVVFDGHGSDLVIEVVREILKELRPFFDQIMGSEDPVGGLHQLVTKRYPCPWNESSGATMCLVKIYANRLVCINCGDSQAAVYKDGHLVHFSTQHNWEHADERARMEAMGLTFEATQDIAIESPTRLRGVYAEYVAWPNGKRLACTQALGHEGRTGFLPDTVVLPLHPDAHYKVVVGSDGVWDMLMKTEVETLVATMSGQALLELVQGRWTQEWLITPYGSFSQPQAAQFDIIDCDDMALIVADITASCPESCAYITASRATPPLAPG